MRISLLRRIVPVSSVLSAGAIDGGLHSFTAVLVTVSGIIATLLLAPLSGAWRVYGLLIVALLVSVAILAVVAVTRRWTWWGMQSERLGDCLAFTTGLVASSRSLIRPNTTC